mmetsp:Transcript_66489/g.192661  ORF Transcript_66489/g.192661 Transcript_66489/m.192661 type:complete len:124 (-) Transcript_66489:10-381(-)
MVHSGSCINTCCHAAIYWKTTPIFTGSALAMPSAVGRSQPPPWSAEGGAAAATERHLNPTAAADPVASAPAVLTARILDTRFGKLIADIMHDRRCKTSRPIPRHRAPPIRPAPYCSHPRCRWQ